MKKRIFGIIAMLAPLWLFFLQRAYLALEFSSTLFCVLCIVIVMACIICLILHIYYDISKKTVIMLEKKNKIYIIFACFFAIIIFTLLFITFY